MSKTSKPQKAVDSTKVIKTYDEKRTKNTEHVNLNLGVDDVGRDMREYYSKLQLPKELIDKRIADLKHKHYKAGTECTKAMEKEERTKKIMIKSAQYAVVTIGESLITHIVNSVLGSVQEPDKANQFNITDAHIKMIISDNQQYRDLFKPLLDYKYDAGTTYAKLCGVGDEKKFVSYINEVVLKTHGCITMSDSAKNIMAFLYYNNARYLYDASWYIATANLRGSVAFKDVCTAMKIHYSAGELRTIFEQKLHEVHQLLLNRPKTKEGEDGAEDGEDDNEEEEEVSQQAKPVKSGKSKTVAHVSDDEDQQAKPAKSSKSKTVTHVSDDEDQQAKPVKSGKSKTVTHVSDDEDQQAKPVKSGKSKTVVHVSDDEDQQAKPVKSGKSKTVAHVSDDDDEPLKPVKSGKSKTGK